MIESHSVRRAIAARRKRIAHVVVTDNFAGTERYVCGMANETVSRGWDVTVIGGHPASMREELAPSVHWLPGATPGQALTSVQRAGRLDVCHVHLTLAEAVAVATRRIHRGRIVSTRHFAQRRGASLVGRLLSPWIARHLQTQIAISDYVAERLESPPDVVIRSGVPPQENLWTEASRTVLVLQRLELEKDTQTALRAWHLSGLSDAGWCLRIVGDGSQRPALEQYVDEEGIRGVQFVGHSRDVVAEFRGAGVLVAPPPLEPFGLSVVEAMAAGVPVVAAAGGGHLETAGAVPGAALFPPYDAEAAAHVLASVALDPVRRREMSALGRRFQRQNLTVGAVVDRALSVYLG